MPANHETPLIGYRWAKVGYLLVSVVGGLIAAGFMGASVSKVGFIDLLGMVIKAVTFQTGHIEFSNGATALVITLLLVYFVLSFRLKKKTLYLVDIATALGVLYLYLGAKQLQMMLPPIIACWVIHRLLLGSLAFRQRRA